MLIKALNDVDQYGRRHDYAWRHSNGRTESTKELTGEECHSIIMELVDEYGITVESADSDRMRKKIISMAHQIGWTLNGKADMQRIEVWCVNKGPYHKPLNGHTHEELTVLVSVFQKIYKQYINKQ